MAGVPHRLQHAGSMFSVFLGSSEPVRDYDDARRTDTAAYRAFFHSMLAQGVSLPPSAFETWFLSVTHTDDVLDEVVAALPAAARAAAAALG